MSKPPRGVFTGLPGFPDERPKRPREVRRILQAYIRETKDVPCKDCEERFPSWAMDFDHRPGTKKRFNISHAVQRCAPLAVIRAEVAKTDVVCCLCHRYRTHGLQRHPDGSVTPYPASDLPYIPFRRSA